MPDRTVAENDYAAAATGATREDPIGSATFPATATRVVLIPQATITGVNTNTRRVEVRNKGQAGAGTTVVASLQFNAGVNGPADDEVVLTLTGTAADREIAEGDVLAVNTVAVGTGLADPGGTVRVEGTYKSA